MLRTAILVLLVPCWAIPMPASEIVDLIHDDFSRYPMGLLSEPVERVRPAIQEYHYFAHRGVPLQPWNNAICYLDSWLAGEEDGVPYLEQHMSPDNARMVVRLFSPIFITGDPEWANCTTEVSVKPLSVSDMAGIVFRYKTNRHHYLFCLQGGNQARLALRLPLEESFRIASFKELGSVTFPYDVSRYYRLKIETQGASIRAYVDGKLLLTVKDDSLPETGKVGISANIPARFQDFHTYTTKDTSEQIHSRILQREAKLASLRTKNPKPKLWKKFDTPEFGCGRNVRFGDLDGDGRTDMLFCQNIVRTGGGNFIEISCLTAMSMDGDRLWQIGRPNSRNGLLTSDCPFQIHDVDGDGKNEVVMVKDFKIQILEGKTGKLLKWAWMPKVPEDFARRRFEIRSRPHERNMGDSIAFFNFSGGSGRHEILIKDRYRFFWVFDNQLEMLFNGHGMLGHFPFAYPSESSPAEKSEPTDSLLIGYSFWDHTGKQHWTRDEELEDHADGVAYGNFSDDPQGLPMGYYSGSDEGFLLIDSHGIIRRHQRIGHTQTALVAKLRPDVPGLQYACINYWKNPGIISILDYQGNILTQGEPIHSGSPFQPVNWRGDGQELILLSGNIREGGMIDGHLRRVVMFPDDGHPDLCAAVSDLTGDPRDEIVLWDQQRVWIYTQDHPFHGKRIYAPRRNPDYNDSNYRTMVSLPDWISHANEEE